MEIYRLFVAIRPPSNIINEVARLQKGVLGARWSDPVKLHITLGYLGDVDGERAETLDQHLAEIRQASFELSLSGTGHFGRNEPHSIWIGISENETLDRLHKAIRSAARHCGIEMEKRDYRPHLTLAYLGRPPDVKSIANWEHLYSGYKSNSFLVDEFFLYSSWRRPGRSNFYKPEASYPLLG